MLGRGRRMRRRGMVAGAAVARYHEGQMEQQYQAQSAADQQAAYEAGLAQAQAAAPQAPPPAADPMDAKIAEIQKLATLHELGALTDEEFATQKQKILNG